MSRDEAYYKGRSDRAADKPCNTPKDPDAWQVFKSDKTIKTEQIKNAAYKEGWHDKDREIPEDNDSGSSGGCFISEAYHLHLGLPDDHENLQRLRKFRDNHLMQTEEGRSLVSDYYKRAPHIVQSIKQCPNANQIYNGLTKTLEKVIALLSEDRFHEAIFRYKEMVDQLEERVDRSQ